MEAVKPLLGDSVVLLSDEMEHVGDRYYVKAFATFVDGEKSTTVTAIAREAEVKKGMDDAQITGSASSYARKYALNGLFAIDDTKDADTRDNGEDLEAIIKQKIALAEITEVDQLKEWYEIQKKKAPSAMLNKMVTAKKIELTK